MTRCLPIIAVLVMMLLLAHAAHAHLFAPSLLKVVETQQHHYNVVWKTPAKVSTNSPLRPSWPDSCAAVPAVNSPQMEGTAIVSSWQLLCDLPGQQGLVGQVLGVTGLGVNQVSAMVMLTLRDGRNYQQLLTAQSAEFRVPVEPPQRQVMTEYAVLGAEHIWGGIDHLLLVLGLLLLVGTGSRLIWTITAFTVGHSITLSLVTLGFLSYPVLLVEFTIALSVFMLALALARSGSSHKSDTNDNNDTNDNTGYNNTNDKNDNSGLIQRYPWWLAGGIGLQHGMGFAGALAAVGLPQSSVLLALLSFNIGIELGQIAFVLLLLSAWWLLKRWLKRWQHRLLPVSVYALGGLSAMWCIERGLVLLR